VLAPGLLVASPTMQCPFFNHTVVVLAAHGEEGSFGLVVNKPLEVTFPDVINEMGVELDGDPPDDVSVMLGGPVSPESGYILFDRADAKGPWEQNVPVGDALGMTTSIHLLKKLSRNSGPMRRMLVLGYAGWTEGQLEREMREGSWIPVDINLDLLFAVKPEDRWRRALASIGVDPGMVMRRSAAVA
jgi:putative transcriptional regulator